MRTRALHSQLEHPFRFGERFEESRNRAPNSPTVGCWRDYSNSARTSAAQIPVIGGIDAWKGGESC